MAAGMAELRTPVMILVDVSWLDTAGVLQKCRACMEDKSASGACIRVKTAIALGSKLKIQWRFEQFFGIVKYCRLDGREYLVGVQKDVEGDSGSARAPGAENPQPIPNQSPQTDAKSNEPQPVDSRVLQLRTDGSPEGGETKGGETDEFRGGAEAAAPVQNPLKSAIPARQLRHMPAHRREKERKRPRLSPRKDFDRPRRNEVRENEAPKRADADRERKAMAHKWLGLAPWRSKPDEPRAGGHEGSDGKTEKEIPMPQPAPNHTEKAPVFAREVPNFQVELLAMEDIYRTAGIISPRKGYSVTKVVEMLNSEHIRGLSKETKRAALLMALDAAGVSIEQVQRDAKSRQGALDAYEAEQKKQVEAEWSRKAEEITHIQAEMESIKAHYTARISRNMEALARDRARFNSWVTTKEQESQSMAEAVELCLQTPGSEPVASREREMRAAAASSVATAAVAAKPM
jgi:hypothetical protein